MTLIQRPATVADIEHIVANLWRRGVEEYETFGCFTPEDLVHRFTMFATEDFSFVLADHEPVVFMGAMRMAPGRYHTWFQATERFDEVGREATRMIRRYLREQMDAHPDATLDLITATRHPKAEAWFHLLGFRRAGDDPPHRVYRYGVEC